MTSDPSDPPGLPQPLLLATKLHAPAPRADRVRRERLFDRLDCRAALSLVSAPAGFGKSTLVSDWLRQRERPAAWVSLDPADSDLRRFLAYVIAALDRPLPGVGRGMAAALTASRLPDPETLLTPLVNELWGCGGCVLVLDDYHVIEAPEVHEALSFLLDHLPPGVSLVVATRADPPLPLPRLRARGLLCEIRAEDLRFTSAEAALFLRETMGLDVSPEEVEALESRTEGWIAGLQMAALSLRGRDDVSAFIAGFTGSHRFVLDYLTEEVLDRQPADRMDFLLATAILPRLSGPLCDVVTGRSDGQEVLESLETANLFLIPLDETRGWYRYHHLFASLLEGELRRRVPAAGIADLHCRASDWFAAHGLPDEAMDHAAAAGDWDRALEIFVAHGDATLHRGEVGMFARWLGLLPEDCFRRHPRLLIAKGIALFASFRLPEFAAVLTELERAEAGADDPELTAGLDALRALAFAGKADHEGVVAFASRALERLPASGPIASTRGLVALTLGMSLGRVGQSERALEVLAEAARLTLAAGNLVLAVIAITNQGGIEALHGRMGRALEHYRQALGLFGGAPLPAAAQAWDGLAHVHLAKGELDAALEHAETATRLSRSGEVVGLHVHGLATLLLVHTARGDFDAARRTMDELRGFMLRTGIAVWDTLNESLAVRIDLAEARLENRPDLFARAERWAREGGLFEGWDQLRERLMPELPRDYAHLTLAHLLVAVGRSAEALELLAALRTIAEEEGWVLSQIEIALLEALARPEPPDCFEPLARALALAAPEGYLQLFASEGEPLARLLAVYDRAHPGALETPFGRRLRSALGLSVAPSPVPAKEPLSDREIEVLRAVSTGLSNAEAARRLYLSPYTVKKHLENIYGKLGVRNRTEAIARLQGAGLL